MRWRDKKVLASMLQRVDELASVGMAEAPPVAIRRVELVLRYLARVATRSNRGWRKIGAGAMTVLLDHMMPWAPSAVRYFESGQQKRVVSPQWLMLGPELDIVFGVSQDWTVASGPIQPTFYLRPSQMAAVDLARLYTMSYATLKQLANIADPVPVVTEKEEKPEQKQGEEYEQCA